MRCPICGCDKESVAYVLAQGEKIEARQKKKNVPTGSDWYELPIWTSRKKDKPDNIVVYTDI